MRLKFTLQEGSDSHDIVVSTDASATAGAVAERLRSSTPRSTPSAAPGAHLSLRVAPGTPRDHVIPPATPMSQAGVRSGDVVTLTNVAADHGRGRPVATLRVIAGPDAGKQFDLPVGTSLVGRDRDCEIRLSDPLVSRRHAKVTITDRVEIVNDRSSNGIEIDGVLVERVTLTPGLAATIGDTQVSVVLHTAVAADDSQGAIAFNRSPRLDPTYAGVELTAPEPPQRSQHQRFPWMTILAPLLMGVVLYAVTKSLLSIMFVGLSPLLLIGSYFENRRAGRAELALATAEFRKALTALTVELQGACELERTMRRQEHPSVADVAGAVRDLTPLLWTRRPEHDRFAEVRFGLGVQASRNSVKMPERNRTTPELWRELNEVVGEFSRVDRVPVVASLAEAGGIGVAGTAELAGRVAAGILIQLVGLHSPAELVLCAVTTANSAERWRWAKWLPHAGSEHSPIDVEHLASNAGDQAALTAALEGLVRERSARKQSRDERPVDLPLVVVVVEDDAATDRARLVQLAELGPASGVHVLWVAPAIERVPAACRSFVCVDPNTHVGRGGFVHTSEGVDPIELEPLDLADAEMLARTLSPVIDAGALLDDQSDLPRTVSLVTIAGSEVAEDPGEILTAWRATNSLPEPTREHLRRDNHLRALIGVSTSGPYHVDLRADGPHALVGGTTGSGKSEFLQSWILSLAATHSPARVNFLFVDYKGGSAFSDCVLLPHSVGLVTDLSSHLVRRALRSLRAELRRREQVLNAKKAKDLLELERRRDPDAPPSLIIVVDEFAALVAEVPEFVDGVVDVAQRGRSLGLHLILATQRPAGVIKDNLRANTNLRVALRMADEDDSTDVVGSAVAAGFDTAIPGRGVVKTGPARVVSFQSAYVGGHTAERPPPPVIDVHDLPFGRGTYWDEQAVPDQRPAVHGPADIQRVVTNIIAANRQASLAAVRQPWLPELAPTYQLEELPSGRTDRELVFGVIDRPDEQSQPIVAFHPDRDGNMAVFGTGGAGKSTVLRSIAVAASFASARGGPCHIYGLDFGARGLAMIDELPNVGSVVNGDDDERVARLLRFLRTTIDDRAERFAAHNADTIVQYRASAGMPDEPRILLLIDNFSAFRQTYETGRGGSLMELLESIVAEGRSAGVHLVAAADQVNAFTTSLRSVIQSQLSLRLVADNDLMTLGIPLDVFSEVSPPGRGYMDGGDVQVAVLGGTQNVALQAQAMHALAAAGRRAGVLEAPPILRLGDDIRRSSLDQVDRKAGAFAVWDETLAPIPFEPRGVVVVAGPARSGRTNTVATMVQAAAELGPNRLTVVAPRQPEISVVGSHDTIGPGESFEPQISALIAALECTDPAETRHVVVVERLTAFAILEDERLEALLRAVRSTGHLAIVEDESSELSGGYGGLLSVAKADRQGVLLQPEPGEGDIVFGVEAPSARRADFPPGRGYYVHRGRAQRVQILRADDALAGDLSPFPST